ncbi:HigA family addiction module antitoxin [Methylocystis echinoides]|uniref:HigA family addiction module antitoxin n=1 Tax=Methylocystis echinoides TaxID=29468 RepID=UPI0034245E82
MGRRHGRYHHALTQLFLAGGFPERVEGGGAAERPPAKAAERASRPGPPQRPPPEPAPSHAARARRDPVRRGGRPSKFSPASVEGRIMTPHPGQVLAQHLADLGLTASDLARDIDVPVNRVTAILNGQRGVTADTALRLGHWFGVDPEDWLGLQLEYELALARHEAGARVKRLPRLADRVL